VRTEKMRQARYRRMSATPPSNFAAHCAAYEQAKEDPPDFILKKREEARKRMKKGFRRFIQHNSFREAFAATKARSTGDTSTVSDENSALGEKSGLASMARWAADIKKSIDEFWLEFEDDEGEWKPAYLALSVDGEVAIFEDGATTFSMHFNASEMEDVERAHGEAYYECVIEVALEDGDELRLRPPSEHVMKDIIALFKERLPT